MECVGVFPIPYNIYGARGYRQTRGKRGKGPEVRDKVRSGVTEARPRYRTREVRPVIGNCKTGGPFMKAGALCPLSHKCLAISQIVPYKAVRVNFISRAALVCTL
jgi:hypothetical protein